MQNPLMHTSPGITEPNITRHPIGTEGEMTKGPDRVNPFRSVEEAEIVEEIERKERERAKRDDTMLRTVPKENPAFGTLGNPLAGDDPFVFDDVEGEVDRLELPFADSEAPSFPDF